MYSYIDLLTIVILTAFLSCNADGLYMQFCALIGWKENMRYAIYGAGSLGTVLGAYITEAGTEIELINRNKEHVDALSRNGAVIEGGIQKTVPVTAITPDFCTIL